MKCEAKNEIKRSVTHHACKYANSVSKRFDPKNISKFESKKNSNVETFIDKMKSKLNN